LHVTHNVRPFVNRIRYAPEVASKPDRLAKDLSYAKKLASLLEDEAATLRRLKVRTVAAPPRDDAAEANKGVEGSQDSKDVVMLDFDAGEDQDDPEPSERGSDAVERRIEKIMAEMRDQGLIDINDETAYNAKKVSDDSMPPFCFAEKLNACPLFIGCDFAGSVPRIPPRCLPYVLLLLRCDGSSRRVATEVPETCQEAHVEDASRGDQGGRSGEGETKPR